MKIIFNQWKMHEAFDTNQGKRYHRESGAGTRLFVGIWKYKKKERKKWELVSQL